MECSLCGSEINSLSVARDWPVDSNLSLLVHKSCIDGAVAAMNKAHDPQPAMVQKSSGTVTSVYDSTPESMNKTYDYTSESRHKKLARKSQVHVALEDELASNPKDYAVGDSLEINGEHYLVAWETRKVPVPFQPNDGYMHKAKRLEVISKHANSAEELEARKR